MRAVSSSVHLYCPSSGRLPRKFLLGLMALIVNSQLTSHSLEVAVVLRCKLKKNQVTLSLHKNLSVEPRINSLGCSKSFL